MDRIDSAEVKRLMRDRNLRRSAYTDRRDWALRLFHDIKPKGRVVGVEVGLWKADFAKLILDSDPRVYWYGVDPYFEYGKMKRKQPEWDAIYERVMNKMKPFGKRFKMVRKPSSEGFNFIPKKVDFVFIDGNHDEDFVYEDLRLYEPRVRKGGIISGHDYSHRVYMAVDRYVEEYGRKLHVDTSFDPCGVFWWRM